MLCLLACFFALLLSCTCHLVCFSETCDCWDVLNILEQSVQVMKKPEIRVISNFQRELMLLDLKKPKIGVISNFRESLCCCCFSGSFVSLARRSNTWVAQFWFQPQIPVHCHPGCYEPHLLWDVPLLSISVPSRHKFSTTRNELPSYYAWIGKSLSCCFWNVTL
jgi:hypothetical protein